MNLHITSISKQNSPKNIYFLIRGSYRNVFGKISKKKRYIHENLSVDREIRFKPNLAFTVISNQPICKQDKTLAINAIKKAFVDKEVKSGEWFGESRFDLWIEYMDIPQKEEDLLNKCSMAFASIFSNAKNNGINIVANFQDTYPDFEFLNKEETDILHYAILATKNDLGKAYLYYKDDSFNLYYNFNQICPAFIKL